MGKKKAKRTRAEIAADRRRTGRPPKPAAEKKSALVMIRLTQAERAHLEVLAKKEGLSLASLIMRPWRERRG